MEDGLKFIFQVRDKCNSFITFFPTQTTFEPYPSKISTTAQNAFKHGGSSIVHTRVYPRIRHSIKDYQHRGRNGSHHCEKFIFWEDIETFFPGLQQVRRDNIMVAYMRDKNGQR